MTYHKNNKYINQIIYTFIVASSFFFIGFKTHEITYQEEHMSVRFSPQDNCLEKIVEEISKAKNTVLVQTYSFTSKDITDALIEQSKKGVKIILIADNSQKNNLSLYKLQSENIEVLIDKVPGIAHNKVIIIDDNTVLTGSFNFSHAAQYRNAENSLTINSKNLCKQYTNNFWLRYYKSKPLNDEINNNLI